MAGNTQCVPTETRSLFDHYLKDVKSGVYGVSEGCTGWNGVKEERARKRKREKAIAPSRFELETFRM